jgi:hypothetical protein
LLQRSISVELDTKGRRSHAQRLAAALYERPDSGNTHAQYEGHPGHTFASDHAHLERPAFVDRGE